MTAPEIAAALGNRVNAAALVVLPALLDRCFIGGRRGGRGYVALNPRRTARE